MTPNARKNRGISRKTRMKAVENQTIVRVSGKKRPYGRISRRHMSKGQRAMAVAMISGAGEGLFWQTGVEY